MYPTFTEWWPGADCYDVRHDGKVIAIIHNDPAVSPDSWAVEYSSSHPSPTPIKVRKWFSNSTEAKYWAKHNVDTILSIQ
jgi:hypothetical protein